MNKLVFVKDNKVVTDSLTVAETFGKSHDKVLRDLRELGCSKEFSSLILESQTTPMNAGVNTQNSL